MKISNLTIHSKCTSLYLLVVNHIIQGSRLRSRWILEFLFQIFFIIGNLEYISSKFRRDSRFLNFSKTHISSGSRSLVFLKIQKFLLRISRFGRQWGTFQKYKGWRVSRVFQCGYTKISWTSWEIVFEIRMNKKMLKKRNILEIARRSEGEKGYWDLQSLKGFL